MDDNNFNNGEEATTPLNPMQPESFDNEAQTETLIQPDYVAEQSANYNQVPQPEQQANYNQVPQPEQSANYNQMPQPEQQANYNQVPQPDNYQQAYQQADFQQQLSQAGYQAQTPDGNNPKKPKKAKKPWSKGKIAAVAGGGAVIAAGIACAVIFLVLPMFKPAKDVVVDAFENTFDAYKEETYIEKTYGVSDMLLNYYTNGGDVNMSFAVNDIEGLDISDISDYKFSCSTSYNPVDKLINFSTAAVYKDEDIIGLDVIGTEDNTYLSVDELIDGYFMLPNEDFLNEIKDSDLGELMQLTGVALPEVSINYFPDTEAASQTDSNELVPEYVDAIEKLWDGVNVTKEGKAKINLHDDTVTAVEYYLTFNEADIEAAMTSVIDGVISQLDEVAEMSEYDDETDIEQYKTAMSQFKALLPSLISDDLVVKVYIKDKKVVKLTCAPSGSIMGITMGFDFSLDLTDDRIGADLSVNAAGEEALATFDFKKDGNNGEGSLVLSAGDETVAFDYNVEVTDDDTTYYQKCRTEAFLDGSSLAVSVTEFTLDKNSETFTESVAIESDSIEDVKASVSGSIFDDEKGVSLGIKIDSVTLSDGDDAVMECNFSYKIDTSKVSAENIKASVPVYEITKLTEDDLYDIVMENQDRILTWVEGLSSYSIVSEIFDVDDSDYDSDDDFVDWDENDANIADDAPNTSIATETDATETDAEPADSDNESTKNEDVTSDANEAVISSEDDSIKVTVKAELEGFSLEESDGYILDYEDSDECNVEYEIFSEYGNAEEIMEEYSDIDMFEYDQELTSVEYNGETIYYFIVHFEGAEDELYYLLAKDLDDSNVLTISAYTGNEHFTLDELLAAISEESCVVTN